MKKLLTLAAVAVLILGLAAATYAVEFKVNGFITNYTLLGRNLNNFPVAGFTGPDAVNANTNTGYDDIYANYNLWAHLDFTLEASEDLKGVFSLEAGNDTWGVAGEATWYPGGALNIYQAYVDAKVPGTDAFPTRAVIGVQLFAFSPQLAIFDYAPGVRFNSTVGPASVSLFWRKHDEGVRWESDDIDSYGASFGMPVGPVSLSAWSIYYVLRENAADGALPAGILADFSDGYHWYGSVGARGAVGPVGLSGEFVYGMRRVDYNYPILSVGGGWYGQNVIYDGEEASGWVTRVTAAVPIGMFTVGGEFMYGTGHDNADWANDREWSGYQIPIATRDRMGLNLALIGDAALIYYRSYSHVWPGYTSNPGDDWYAKGFARVKPLEWMTVTMNALYIGDNVKNGDRFGTAVDFLGFPEDNDDAGIEVDLITRFQIYENLSAEIGLGYLFAGSAFDQYVPGSFAAYGIPINDSPKDPWVVLTNLSFTF